MNIPDQVRQLLYQAYLDRKYCHCSSDKVQFNTDLFDTFFQYTNFRDGDIRVFKHGQKINPGIFTNTATEPRFRRINKHKIIQLLNDGHTIIFEDANLSDKYFSELAATISELFDTDSWVNCYLTPKGTHGFDIHADNHDVIVVQLYGEKTWYLYPENGDEHKFNLGKNQLLYIPKGLKHKAETSDQHSLHATIGFNPRTYYSVLKDMVLGRLSAYDNKIYQKGDKEQLDEIFKELSRTPNDLLVPSNIGRTGDLNILAQLEKVSSIDENTVLSFNPEVTIIKHEDRLELSLPAAIIQLQLTDFDFIRAMRMKEVFTLSGIKADQDMQRKLQIARDLFTNNMLVIK